MNLEHTRMAKVTEQFRILSAEFLYSVYSLNDLSQSYLPEVAFVGRSNSGKSSVINRICKKKNLAQVSKMPGRTQALNFFRIRFSEIEQNVDSNIVEQREEFYAHFVDLPGYGYARVSKAVKNKWPQIIENYLLCRKFLSIVVLLVDCRREIEHEEKTIAELGQKGNLFVLLTKSDKLSHGQQVKRRIAVERELCLQRERIILTSSIRSDNIGVMTLRNQILSILIGELKQ